MTERGARSPTPRRAFEAIVGRLAPPAKSWLGRRAQHTWTVAHMAPTGSWGGRWVGQIGGAPILLRSSVAVTARILVGGERDRVWRQAVVLYPAHAGHQRRAMPEVRS